VPERQRVTQLSATQVSAASADTPFLYGGAGSDMLTLAGAVGEDQVERVEVTTGEASRAWSPCEVGPTRRKCCSWSCAPPRSKPETTAAEGDNAAVAFHLRHTNAAREVGGVLSRVSGV
jgi:hypothetical protein